MDNLSNVETVFFAALAKGSPEERAAYLAEACGGDVELRRSVERLLSAHPEVGSFLQSPALAGTADEPSNRESSGMMVGPYKLLQRIGEGGMGTVYMAEQVEPIRRLVAVKIIKPGLDSAEVLARFEAERQALALMDHPNVAKVLDAGATDSGRPYFVMELIHGIPITDYCNQRRLDPRERLELFIPVCQAVQHAHQKGIIHRDLKPSNVLVALYDGKPVPKVIDFGVAKATAQKLTERTLVTRFGALVGTIEYMSPEQAELNQLDVDTRSDVYTLGVLLYELLTGETPLGRRRLQETGLLERLRRVREEEPPTPSNRLSSSPELPALSEQRSMEPARLARLVRGELDWIVMKTLEKDRSRRYETAVALADEIQRYLDDELVQAGPPSARYRLRKFLKRNRVPVVATAGLFVTLVAGVIGTTLGLREAMQSQSEAVKARDDAQELAERLREAIADLQAKTLRIGSARHASQLDLALHAWERRDVAEAEQVLGEVEPAFQQTWEQRHLHGLCHRVRRLAGSMGPPLDIIKPPNGRPAVAFSANGLLVASAGYLAPSKPVSPGPLEEMVKVCEFATGREKITIRTTLISISTLAFSPSGRQIALAAARPLEGIDPRTGNIRGGLQSVVEVFDVATGQKAFSLRGKNWDDLERIDSVAFSADSRRIVVKSQDGQVNVWDAADGREVFSLHGPLSEILLLQFGPDGKRIATVSDSKGSVRGAEVWLWDGESGEPKFRLRKERGCLATEIRMAFSPDGRHIAVKGTRTKGEGPEVYIYDTATGQKEVTLQVANAQAINGLAFSRDGRLIIVQINGGDALTVYEVATGREKGRLDGRQKSDNPNVTLLNGVSCFAVSADGGRIAAGNTWGTVTVWDFATGKELFTGKELLAIEGASRLPAIATMAFSPDGRRLGYCAVDWSPGGTDNERRNWVKVLDIGAKRIAIHIPLKRAGFYVESLAFSPDGQRVIAVSREKKDAVMEWDLATGEVKSTLQVPVDTIALAYLADTPRLTARGEDGSVYVQDAVSGKHKVTLKSMVVGPITSVAFSPDGKRIATRNGDQTVKVWNLATARELFTLPGPLDDCSRESFSPDGSAIALISDGVGKVFDATEGRDVWRRQPVIGGRANDASSERGLFTIQSGDSRIVRLAYRPDGGALVSRTEDGQVKIYGPFGGQSARSLKEDTGIVDFLFSPDGGRMAVVSGNRESGQRVRLWDSGHPFNNRLLEFPKESVSGVVFTGNTAHVIANGPEGLIRVWDETGQATRTFQAGSLDAIHSVGISPDGQLIAAGGATNDVKAWDAVTGDEKLALEWPKSDPLPLPNLSFLGPVHVCFSPDVHRFVATTMILHVLDAQTGKEVLALSGHKHIVLNAFWSLDGRCIASSSMDGTIRVWDARIGQEWRCITIYRGGGRDPGLLAISPDGASLIVQPRDYDHPIWGPDGKLLPGVLGTRLPTVLPTVSDAATGEVKLSLQGRPGRVRCSTFSSDGRRIVTGEEDGILRLWDAATGEELMVLKGHTGAVWTVAFSRDGQQIVSGGIGKADPDHPGLGELKVWDAVTGQEKLSLKGHAGRVTGAAFSRDGQRIVSGSDDRTVKVWEAPAADPRTPR